MPELLDDVIERALGHKRCSSGTLTDHELGKIMDHVRQKAHREVRDALEDRRLARRPPFEAEEWEGVFRELFGEGGRFEVKGGGGV